MADVLMVARPAEYAGEDAELTAEWLTADDVWRDEELVKQHDEVLWQAFNTRGKYQHKVRRADGFVVVRDEQKNYLGSAFIVEVWDKWLVENVMTDPSKQARGVGSAVMHRLMSEAKARGIERVILNCDDEKNDGQLPKFYGKFGFKTVD